MVHTKTKSIPLTILYSNKPITVMDQRLFLRAKNLAMEYWKVKWNLCYLLHALEYLCFFVVLIFYKLVQCLGTTAQLFLGFLGFSCKTCSQRSSKTMSVKKSLSLNNAEAIKGDVAKRGRYDRCFSFMEVSVEPGKSLKEMDSFKLKDEIKRWAKAVVAYARQVSDRFGSPRSSSWRMCYGLYVSMFVSSWRSRMNCNILIATHFSRLVAVHLNWRNDELVNCFQRDRCYWQ